MTTLVSGSALCPKCGFALEGSAPGAVSCSTCGEHVHGSYCAHCGTEVESGRAFRAAPVEGRGATVRALRVAAGPLAEYIESAHAIIFPQQLIREIREHYFTAIELLGFWVAAAAITALIGAFLPSPMHRLEVPVLAEVLEALLMITITVVIYSPLHLLLRRGRRDVTFREFLITTLAIGALLYPWIGLSYGLQVLLGVRVNVANNINTVVSSAFYIFAYANLYHRSILVTLAMWIGYIAMMVVLLLTLIIAVALIGRSLGYFPDTKPVPTAAVAKSKAN